MAFCRPIIGALGLLAGLWVACAVFSTAAYASTYGSGGYGACAYGTGCTVVTAPSPPPSSPPTSPTPPPLQVTINLTDGETLPDTGYTIIVAPVDPSTDALNQAQFSVNGSPVSTQTPGPDGTVSWTWQPGQPETADVRVVATGKDGQTVTKTFHVYAVASQTSVSRTPASTSLIGALFQLPSTLVQSAEKGIRTLPNVIKYTLPYFLFILLIGDILFLLLHIRREMDESKRLEVLLEREREMGELKKTFMMLISHYLRTPLSVVNGGIGLLKPSDPVFASLQSDAKVLGEKIDELIAQGADNAQTATVGTGTGDDTVAIWRQPMLLIPVLVIGVVVFSFDYLAQNAGAFDQKEINIIIQVVVFGSSAVMLYIVARQLAVRRRHNSISAQILDAQVAFNTHRDAFIGTAAHELSNLVDTLWEHVSKTGQSPAQKFLYQGSQQLHDMVAKFVAASELKGSSSTAPTVDSELSTLCGPVFATLEEKTKAKHVTIKLKNNISVEAQNPELLSLVLQTILDNAIDYSPANGIVDIDAHESDGELTITISDHGPGIPADKQYELFQAFAKVEGAEVFNREGMGFSLYLDRLIMFYLHGSIAVAPVKPQGTKVSLILPSAVVTG